MRKLSKILAVVLSVVLLCGIAATMISADNAAAIIYPEYVSPEGVTVSWNTDFEGGTKTDGFGGMFGMFTEIVDTGSNKYGKVTNVDEYDKIASISNKQYGSLFSGNKTMLGGDYFAFNFDIMADMYSNGTDLITLEHYNELSEEERAGFAPSFAETLFYMEMPWLTGAYNSFYIKQFDGEWYFTIVGGNKDSNSYRLPSEIGVWTNITMLVKTDITVNYNDADGVAETVSYASYSLMDKTGHTDATVTVNTDYAVYANGDYAFDYDTLDLEGKEYDYATFSAGGANISFKYMQMQSTSSALTTATSVCYDNITGVVYADGYEGELDEIFESRSSLLGTDDAVFNLNYNKVGQLGATVTKPDGKVYGYMTVEQAYNAAKSGDVVEILIDNDATILIPDDLSIEVISIKDNGYNFAYNFLLPTRYVVEVKDGLNVITLREFNAPNYVGPLSANVGVNKNFETEADTVTVTANSGLEFAQKEMNGNKYASIFWNGFNGSSISGDIRPGNFGSNGAYSPTILPYDYVTIDFDIVADEWRNTATGALLSIADYDKLSDSDKANYEPAYHQLQFYIEFDKIMAGYTYQAMPQLRKVNDNWSICNGNSSVAISNEAGVWTHVTMVICIDNTVTCYTDETKTETTTMSYADFIAAGKGEADFISISTGNSTASIYVDGEYAFDIASWAKNITGYSNLAGTNAKYMFLKGAAQSSASTFTHNFSMGFDNYVIHMFKEGYSGPFALAASNKTSMNDCMDAPFNKEYNKTGSERFAGIVGLDEEIGVYCYNFPGLLASIKNNVTIKLYNDIGDIELKGVHSFYINANGHTFGKFSAGGVDYSVTETEKAGVYLIKAPDYLPLEYVGPSLVSNRVTDFENGVAYATGAATTTSTVVAGGSKYDQYSFAGGTISDRKDWLSLPSYYINNLLDYEYLTIEYDITADKYTNGTDLITVEEYNALSDEAKAAYYPSYFESEFYWEFKSISTASATKRLVVTKIDGAWYLADASDKTQRYALPAEAGVWTHVTQVVEIGNTATYNTAEGTKTCSFKEFKAMVNAGTVSASDLVSVNVSESQHHVYINGEYAFTFQNWVATNKDTDTYANYINTNSNDSGKAYAIKYGRWRNTATIKAPFSVGLDNQTCHVYADGYNGDFANAIKNKASILDCRDAIYNNTYNKTGVYSVAVYDGVTTGYAYANAAYAFENVKSGDTIELLSAVNAVYVPNVDLVYVKTNGFTFNYELPEGYAYYETETKGTYVLKVAGPDDVVEVDWVVNGEVYKTTYEAIGAPAKLEYAIKVHPWVTELVTAWKDAEGDSYVKPGEKNVFTATVEYKATPDILMNISTTQAIITNIYIPALTEEELAELSGISYAIGTTERWGTSYIGKATIDGKDYYKIAETNRIIYNERDRMFVLSFTYNEMDFSVNVNANAITYFNNVLSSNEYSDVEKALVYAALDYCDAVALNNGYSKTSGFSSMVSKYAEYKSTSTSSLDEIIKSAVQENSTEGLVTGFNISLYDGYAAFFNFVLDTEIAGADFDRATATITYKTLAGGADKVSGTRQYKDGNLTFQYDIAVYDVRQTLTLNIGEVSATFNLAAYIKALNDAGYAEDSAEMRVALALYHYSECSEAYKRS